MKKNNKKKAGLKSACSDMSAENNTDCIKNAPVKENGENKIVRNFIIYSDTDIYELGQEIIMESYKKDPKDFSLHVICAKQYTLNEIKDLGKTIYNSNLTVNVYATGNIDFIGFAFFALCVTGDVYFLEGSKIEMSSLTSIPKSELKRISKKISKRIGVKAKVISKFYNDKAIVDPWDLFIE